MRDLDPTTIIRAAGLSALAAFVVIAVGTAASSASGSSTSGSSGSGSNMLVTLVVLLIFGLAGYGGARTAPDRGLRHGAFAALAAAVLVGIGGAVIRLSRRPDDTLAKELVGLPFFVLLAMSCGLAGGYLAERRRSAADPNETTEPGGNP